MAALTPRTPHSLSMHGDLPEDCDVTEDSMIPVVNPITKEEFLVG